MASEESWGEETVALGKRAELDRDEPKERRGRRLRLPSRGMPLGAAATIMALGTLLIAFPAGPGSRPALIRESANTAPKAVAVPLPPPRGQSAHVPAPVPERQLEHRKREAEKVVAPVVEEAEPQAPAPAPAPEPQPEPIPGPVPEPGPPPTAPKPTPPAVEFGL